MESPWNGSADNVSRQSANPGLDEIDEIDEIDEDPVLSALLRDLLDGPTLTAAYQPIIDICTRRIHGFEALVRARTPTGDVSPVVLVEAATRHGLIDELTVRVAEEALMTVATAVMIAQQPLRLTVNVELEQLYPTNKVVAWLIRRSRFGGVQLVLEITERGADIWTTEHEATAVMLEMAGVELALDDYGAGSARLGFLHHRNWNVVKLDRQFLVYDTPRDRIVLRHFVQMLRELDIPMVAEGVETEAHYQLAKDLGVEYVQGFWLGRPVDAGTLLDSIEQHGLDLPDLPV